PESGQIQGGLVRAVMEFCNHAYGDCSESRRLWRISRPLRRCQPKNRVRSTVKIAVYYNLPPGGAKRALHDQVRGLLQLGHEVSVGPPPHGDDAEPRIGALTPTRIVPVDDEAPPWWSDGRAAGVRSPRAAIKRALEQARAAAQAMNAD